jgi:ankyrin repeat protein
MQIVEVLISHGAIVNQATHTGTRPLHIACFNEHIDVVDILLSNKADANMVMEDDVSPLHGY